MPHSRACFAHVGEAHIRCLRRLADRPLAHQDRLRTIDFLRPRQSAPGHRLALIEDLQAADAMMASVSGFDMTAFNTTRRPARAVACKVESIAVVHCDIDVYLANQFEFPGGRLDKIRRELFGLQILRGLAAIAVVVHHTLETSNGSTAGRFSPDWFTVSGAAGVDVFFVISGFIMLYISFPDGKDAETPLRFLIKRLTRVFPLYWMCSAVMVAIVAAGFLRNKTINFDVLLNSVLLLPGTKLIGISWTLSYELYFYCLFALCLLLGKQLKVAIAATVLIIGGILAGHVWAGSTFGDFVASPLTLEFCLGIFLALMFARSAAWYIQPSVAIAGALLVALAALLVPHADTTGLPDAARAWAWGLPAVLITASFLAVKRPVSVIGRTAVLVGDASYAIYLTHAFGMIAYGWLIKSTIVGDVSQIAVAPIIVLACVVGGIAVHLLVEKPVLRSARNLVEPRLAVARTSLR